MNINILNPENATYRCHSGCGSCCRYAIPLFPSEAFEISQGTGVPLPELASVKKDQIYLSKTKKILHFSG